jgi:hypothetical protein
MIARESGMVGDSYIFGPVQGTRVGRAVYLEAARRTQDF